MKIVRRRARLRAGLSNGLSPSSTIDRNKAEARGREGRNLVLPVARAACVRMKKDDGNSAAPAIGVEETNAVQIGVCLSESLKAAANDANGAD